MFGAGSASGGPVMGAALMINGDAILAAQPLDALGERLAGDAPYLEIWVKRRDARQLSALVNRRHAFLVWMSAECPEGGHSLAPGYPSEVHSEVEFRLANGQIDHFAEDLCSAREEVLMCFSEFWRTGARPKTVEWAADCV